MAPLGPNYLTEVKAYYYDAGQDLNWQGGWFEIDGRWCLNIFWPFESAGLLIKALRLGWPGLVGHGVKSAV